MANTTNNTNTKNNTKGNTNTEKKVQTYSILKKDRFAEKAVQKQSDKLTSQKAKQSATRFTAATASRLDTLKTGADAESIYLSVLALINRADKGKNPETAKIMKESGLNAATLKAALKAAYEGETLQAFINSKGVEDKHRILAVLIADCVKASKKEGKKEAKKGTKGTEKGTK